MSLSTDLTYINQISHKLLLFKKKKDYLYNFRCPVCGDSKKKKTKTRGYLYRAKDMMLYRCHNCGLSTTFGKLLERLDSEIYKRYILERYSNGEQRHTMHDDIEYQSVVIKQKHLLQTLKTVSRLSFEHPVRDYLKRRMIPEDKWNELYLVNNFMTFVNGIIPNKFPNVKSDHPRLLIPFYDEKGKLFGFQGRAFGKETPKYITIMLDNMPKLYNLDKVNLSEKVYVTEGPIDAMFIDNSIAMAGADLPVEYRKYDVTYVFDNEPRNPEIIKRMKKVIEQGASICIWQDSIVEKDINDMIIAGYTQGEVKDIISNNTYSNLGAMNKLNEWKKCV